MSTASIGTTLIDNIVRCILNVLIYSWPAKNSYVTKDLKIRNSVFKNILKLLFFCVCVSIRTRTNGFKRIWRSSEWS